jgi:drug/metabolite transporter (DMT)-like permease
MTDAQFGQLLALLSALGFASSQVFVAKASRGSGDHGVLFSVLVTAVFSGILWLVLESGSLGANVFTEQWWTGVIYFVLGGLFAMVLGRTFVFTAIRRLGVTRSSIVKRLNPFFSVLLAFIILAEPINGWDTLGMLAIALAFLFLIRESIRNNAAEMSQKTYRVIDYHWGVFASLFYASAYICRKQGLFELPAPAFGTMVSAVSGLAFFIIAAGFNERHRNNLRRIFSDLDRWKILAAITVSIGQILFFAALKYEKVSTVVMIASLETFLASFLAVVVFRAEKRPSRIMVISAVIATLGVIAVATA